MVNIELERYNPEWPIRFEEIRYVLLKQLSNIVLSIEHVGSTSVKGLSAKPILDIDIIIRESDQLQSVILKLEYLGYSYEGDLGISGREAFSRIDVTVPWVSENKKWMDHHLYVCNQDNLELKRHLLFREFLRKNPREAFEYERLKKRLAITSVSRSAYTDGKSEFITKILKRLDPSF